MSPVANKSRERKIWDAFDLEQKSDSFPEKRSLELEADLDNKGTDLVLDMEPHNNITCENNSQKQSNRNVMLRRLADCFADKQRFVKSGTKRHRVMGFHPRLYTIHENASELADDLDDTYNSINSDTVKNDLLTNTDQHPITTDCSFDHRVAALHEDIKELWKRLENVEKEFAWARGSLVKRHTDH